MNLRPLTSPHQIHFLVGGNAWARCAWCYQSRTFDSTEAPGDWMADHFKSCRPTTRRKIAAATRGVLNRHGAGVAAGAAAGFAAAQLGTSLVAATALASLLAYALCAFAISLVHMTWRLVIRPAWLVFQSRRKR